MRCENPLSEHLGGEHHIRLAGGTALAARWAHRHSTDVGPWSALSSPRSVSASCSSSPSSSGSSSTSSESRVGSASTMPSSPMAELRLPEGPERIASREELYARYERERFERCILRGGDPEAEGLGPHGSLIGGRSKPLTLFHGFPELRAKLHPLPPSWRVR